MVNLKEFCQGVLRVVVWNFGLFGSLAVVGAEHVPVEPVVAGDPIRSVAAARKIPLEGIEQDPGRSEILVGDRSVVLVSLREGTAEEQWLLDFSVLGRPEVAADLPIAPPFTLHTSTGRQLHFGSRPVKTAVHVLGPLQREEKRLQLAVDRVKEARAGFLVNEEFLVLGLDRMGATMVRLRDSRRKKTEIGFGVSTTPFPAEKFEEVRNALEAQGVQEEDERAVAGAVPALLEFFRVISETPGLNNILFEVVDIPWWSLVRSGGRPNIGMNFLSNEIAQLDASEWAGADAYPTYTLPLMLMINNKPSLRVELIVVRPEGPGLALAGVMGIPG